MCLGETAASTAQEDRQKAVALWEQAITAKGGRDRLEAISSFAILKKTRFRGLMIRDVATGRVDQVVCKLRTSGGSFWPPPAGAGIDSWRRRADRNQ